MSISCHGRVTASSSTGTSPAVRSAYRLGTTLEMIAVVIKGGLVPGAHDLSVFGRAVRPISDERMVVVALSAV